MARTVVHVDERETPIWSFRLLDEHGNGVGSAALSQATLTLYVPATGAIVNGRDAQNVLNANDVTIDDAGVVTWRLQTGDTAILNDGPDTETHRALFRFWWQGGARHKPYEVDFVVRNLGKLV